VNPACRLASDGWTVTVDSGAPSCHVEHTVVVTRDGAEVLTLSPHAANLRRRAG
jgi:methionine aminopeptidase